MGLGKQNLNWRKLPLSLFLFYGWCSVTLLWAPSLYQGLTTLVPWFGSLGVMFLILFLFRTRRDLSQLSLMIFLSGFVVVIIGLLQKWFGFDLYMQASPPSSTLGDKFLAASYAALTLPFGLLLLKKEVKLWGQILFYSGLIFTSLYLHVIASTGVWLVIEFVFLVIIILLLIQKNALVFKRMVIALALMVVGLGSINFYEKNRIVEFSQKISHLQKRPVNALEQEGWERVPVWINGLSLFPKYLIQGVGVGNWRAASNRAHNKYIINTEFFNHLHNDWLEGLITFGLIGFLLLGYFWWTLFKKIKFILDQGCSESALLGSASFASLLGLLFMSFFSYPFLSFSFLILAGVCWGILILVEAEIKKEILVAQGERFFLNVSGLSFLFFLTFLSGYWGYRLVRAEAHHYRARYYTGLGEAHGAKGYKNRGLTHFESSYQYNPYDWWNLTQWAESLKTFGLRDIADKKFAHAADLMPEDFHLLRLFARHYLFSGRPEKAIEIGERIIRSSPHYSYGYWIVGRSNFVLKRKDRAKKFFLEAKARDPEIHLPKLD
ncbi:MAG: hypothetical protein HOM21_05230 [Halobacteriovoraceae bacterium]|jgi:hypothetical protein|nr:hypothetical protein [Halobacteriovoraceae bacterium]